MANIALALLLFIALLNHSNANISRKEASEHLFSHLIIFGVCCTEEMLVVPASEHSVQVDDLPASMAKISKLVRDAEWAVLGGDPLLMEETDVSCFC